MQDISNAYISLWMYVVHCRIKLDEV